MTEPFAPYCLRCFAALPPTEGARLGAKCSHCGRRDLAADRERYRSLHPDDIRRDRVFQLAWFLVVLPAMIVATVACGRTWLVQMPVGAAPILPVVLVLLTGSIFHGLATGAVSDVSAPVRESLDRRLALGLALGGMVDLWIGLRLDGALTRALFAYVLVALCLAGLPSRSARFIRHSFESWDPTTRRLRERGLLKS